MPATNTLQPAVDHGTNLDPRRAPDFLNAGVLCKGDVIEWDGRAHTVLAGKTGPKVREVELREQATGRKRTIRPRRDARVRLLRDRRPGDWAA